MAAPAPLDPVGEEATAEGIAGPDGVGYRDRRDRDLEFGVAGQDANVFWTVREQHDRRTEIQQRPRGVGRLGGRREIDEVVGADLDDVGSGHHAPDTVQPDRAVVDDARPRVRIEHDQRVRINPGDPHCERRGHRFEHETERPEMDRCRAHRERRDDRVERQLWCRGLGGVESVGRAAVVVELSDRERGRCVGRPRHGAIDAVERQRLVEPSPEPIRREDPQERHLAAEPADRPGRVVRAAAADRGKPPVRGAPGCR